MDVQRTGYLEKKRRRRILYVVAGIVVVVLLTIGITRLEPAAPTVPSESVWDDVVERGPMVRQVRGPGSLVPEEIRVITVSTEGRVERQLLQAGVQVEPDSVILELANPELEQRLEDARLELEAERLDLINLRSQLESQLLTQQAEVARVESEYSEAELKRQADEQLAEEGLISDIDLQSSRIRARQLENRVSIEHERLEKTGAAHEAQLSSREARLDQLRAVVQLRRQEVGNLSVRAGLRGVLQEVPVEVGQSVPAGTPLARVAQPEKLKAELRIAETQAKDLQVGLPAEIDTRNGIIEGRVQRIDPAVREGTVTVDIELLGELPPGARPDLSVDGTVQIERLEDVLHMGRPTYGQANSRVELFKIEADGTTAVRVSVQLGRSSVDTIEIVSGLEEGDVVILSDMSQWEDAERVRLD